MPQALIGWLVALGLSVAAATAVAVTVISTLVNIVLMEVISLFTPKQNSGGGPPPPINTTTRSTVEYRRVVFGTVRAGGAIVFYRTSGSSQQYLWYVIAYAGHQCSAVGDAYLDALHVPSADINVSTGLVSTANFNGKLYIATHLGTAAQTTDPWLATDFGFWDTNHRLRGICYRVYRLERDDKAWTSGAPQSISSVISGALLYDPRKDSTNGGSGAHRASDATTWEFSSNPALAVRWFLSGGSVTNDVATRLIKYGMRETDARISDSYTIAAANICDESIAGANAPPGGAELRYALGIEVSCGQFRRDIFTELLATMGPGQLAYVHGTWRVYAAAFDSPVHDFDQNDLYGELEIQDTSSASARFNAVCGTYVDALQGYVQATTIFRTQTAYETQDGGERIEKTLPLRGVTSTYQAQRICELVNRSSRYMRTVKFRFRRSGMAVANWETFTFSHSRYGWTDRVFRCISRELDYQNDGGVLAVITAKQDDAAVYTDLVTADYKTGTSVTSAIQMDLPDTPTALTASAIGGQNIRFDWTIAPFWQLNGVVELWEYTASTPFSSAAMVWFGRGSTAVITRDDTVTRYYWVTVRTLGGQRSASFPASAGVAAAASQVGTTDLEAAAASQIASTYVVGRAPFGVPFITFNAASPATHQSFGGGPSLSLTITCTGAPIAIDVMIANVLVSLAAGVTVFLGTITVLRDGSIISCPEQEFKSLTDNNPICAFTFTDAPSAGSHTYEIVGSGSVTGGGATLSSISTQNVAYKIREIKR